MRRKPPFHRATKNTSVASRAAAYGLPGVEVDGNDVMAVYEAAGTAIAKARSNGGPTLIECKTYRTVGHHEGDPGTDYRTKEEVESWKRRCPIKTFRERVLASGQAAEEQFDEINRSVERWLEDAVEFARTSPDPDPNSVLDHIWCDERENRAMNNGLREITYVDAGVEALREEMLRDETLIYLGQGIGPRGGNFRQTRGLWKEFGDHRLRDTGICELGTTGVGIGAAMAGSRVVVDEVFLDFILEAMTQVVQQAAKVHYSSNGKIKVPIVIRGAMGSVRNAGSHHSHAFYAWFAHTPG